CVTFPDSTIFYEDACYSTIQGTSMSTPHVSAVAALIASANPRLRHDPDAIQRILLDSARGGVRNTTPPVDPDDTSPGDLTGAACPTGNCHLGGRPISRSDA